MAIYWLFVWRYIKMRLSHWTNNGSTKYTIFKLTFFSYFFSFLFCFFFCFTSPQKMRFQSVDCSSEAICQEWERMNETPAFLEHRTEAFKEMSNFSEDLIARKLKRLWVWVTQCACVCVGKMCLNMALKKEIYRFQKNVDKKRTNKKMMRAN